MSKESILLASNLTQESAVGLFVYTDKKPGAGYYKLSDGIHTVIYQVDSFTGVIKLQGTLELYPGEEDWIDITDTIRGVSDGSSAWVSEQTTNFTGNFVWLRAAYNLINGTIVQIRYNY